MIGRRFPDRNVEGQGQQVIGQISSYQVVSSEILTRDTIIIKPTFFILSSFVYIFLLIFFMLEVHGHDHKLDLE